MLCAACRESFEAKREQAGPRYCSDKCRAALWRRRKAEAGRERNRKVRGLLEEAIEVLGEGGESS